MSYAKRTRTITADDGNISISVFVTVGVLNKNLTRDEHNTLTENAASQVMRLIPDLPYIRVPLSKVKVTR